MNKLQNEPMTPVPEKAPNIIVSKATSIIDQMESIYSPLAESIDRLGGSMGPSPEKGADLAARELPGVMGESFYSEIDGKLTRIKSLVDQFDIKISRLNELI